jgi:threonylcarbamoyladenosine tRNA methylthiotransferase MtaB
VTTFAVKFLGCKVSQADAMLARAALIRAGHTEAPESEAELHVINTCCITSEAEAKSRQSVRRSLRGTADRRVFVSGCAVNLRAGQFAEIDDRVSPFVGTAEDVAESMSADLGACADLEHDLLARDPITPAARTRGFVKVQDGCDCHCAWRPRSSPRSHAASTRDSLRW